MQNEIEKGKTTAIVSYITIIGSVIAIFMNQDENKSQFASFHIRQALGIFSIFFLLGYFVSYFDSWMITSALWVFVFVLWFYGFIAALNNEQKTVPIIGKLAQKIFKNL